MKNEWKTLLIAAGFVFSGSAVNAVEPVHFECAVTTPHDFAQRLGGDLRLQEPVADLASCTLAEPCVFEGQRPPFGAFNAGADITGDVGANHYLQTTNGAPTRIAIYDKAGRLLVDPPVPLSALGDSDTQPLCGTDLMHDGVVIYDEEAERWVISAMKRIYDNRLCIAVSKTSDPVAGGWWTYDFNLPTSVDYPKIAQRGENYFVNHFRSSSPDGVPLSIALAFEREKMLAGEPARCQQAGVPEFDVPEGAFTALFSADVSGAMAAAVQDAPGLMVRPNDDEVTSPDSADPTQDFIELFTMNVDWDDPGQSGLSSVAMLPTPEFSADFRSDCDDVARCIPQGIDATALRPVTGIAMWSPLVRSFADYQSLTFNLTVNVSGDDVQAGVRWYELRKPIDGAWGIFQEGTYTPTSDMSAFIGSLAMDRQGNIALGYSTSGPNESPAAGITGRIAADAPGVMGQGATAFVPSDQPSETNQWVDYSAMRIDPVDGCTFWYTNTNYAGRALDPISGVVSGNWPTKVARFNFDSCPADSDGDGVTDANDNCLLVANPDQIDTNGDGFGNQCDADFNNDCGVNVQDLALLRTNFFGDDPDYDLTGDGFVNVSDLSILRRTFFEQPGPSGSAGACAN